MGGSPSPTFPASGGLMGVVHLFLRIEGNSMAKNSENLNIVYDDVTIDVGALASKDCIASASKIDSSRLNGFRIIKTEYWMDFEGKTAGEGPIMVGFSPLHSASEVEDTIEADPQSSAEMENNAVAKRPVFPLEMYPTDGGDTNFEQQRIKKGSFNPRWSVIEGRSAFWWVYNMEGAALTTGMLVHIFAKHYGVWLRD